MNPSNDTENTDNTDSQPKRRQLACFLCRKRKVKCDVTLKNYPTEKCSNCERFGVDCIVQERKRKRKKTQSQEDDFPFTGSTLSTDSTVSNGLSIDSEKYLSTELDKEKVITYFQSKPISLGVRSSLPLFFSARKVTYRDLISQERIIVLKSCGCFQLPSLSKCQIYLKAFFERYNNSYYPILSPTYFDKLYKDITNPLSLPLLRSMLYMGCKILSKTHEDQIECCSLYQKAKLTLDSHAEINGVFVVLCYLLLETPPSETVEIMSIDETVKTSIRTMFAYECFL
ncbi:unnamed protein product [Ambrosiozyma monospora]|uniref:Unnamed protein product n=1 Tax=Ambrosiozyma monospora TaxID=43982 RepID=A0A9W6Z074_AMBMO|nr:unnamed protein product [Ambrosiozyma monospora]